MAKDPVCGMNLKGIDEFKKNQLAEKGLFFCSDHCKSRFEKNPEKFRELMEKRKEWLKELKEKNPELYERLKERKGDTYENVIISLIKSHICSFK